MTIQTADFDYVRTVLKQRAAIVLEPGKEYLVEARLMPIARAAGCDGLTGLVDKLKLSSNSALMTRVIEAMTTNETSWFRDLHPFEALCSKVMPEVIATRAAERTIRMWCGASSSGQEPYTVLILLAERFPQLKDWTIDFLATDLSSEMVAKCTAGKYSQLEMNRGMPTPLLLKYFERDGLDWRVKPELRSRITFKTMNLSTPWPSMRTMDIVFLRNVMIYFDVSTKKQILSGIHRLLRPGGWLFLGSAESTLGIHEGFERVTEGKAVIYRPGKV
ncbi:MAG: protein-glutamate O-methyltransferase CheR [Planctomycetota bacterium]